MKELDAIKNKLAMMLMLCSMLEEAINEPKVKVTPVTKITVTNDTENTYSYHGEPVEVHDGDIITMTEDQTQLYRVESATNEEVQLVKVQSFKATLTNGVVVSNYCVVAKDVHEAHDFLRSHFKDSSYRRAISVIEVKKPFEPMITGENV